MGTFAADVQPSRPSAIVAFDFDGTLTHTDSFMAFLRWRAGPALYVVGLARLIPATIGYLAHRDRGRLKAAAARVFLRGSSPDGLRVEAEAFAEQVSGSLLRPDALRGWNSWRARGGRMVVVTASPRLLVEPFARRLGAETTLGTELALDARGRITGALRGANCRGAEKVRRLEAAFGSGVRLAAAYGDTAGDREMLSLADEAGYRVFTERA